MSSKFFIDFEFSRLNFANYSLMEPGLMCQDVSNMNRANLAKFPDSVLESQATVQMIILEEFVNLIVYLDRISDRFVPLMVPGNLIQPVTVIFAIPGTVVTGAQENLVGLVTGLLKQLEVNLYFYPPIQKARFNMRHPV